MKRTAAVVAVALLSPLASTAPASAAPPERYTDSFQISDTIDCSQFQEEWAFHDNFTDFFTIRGQEWLDEDGNLTRAIEHVEHTSNDVNSVTGLSIHEHNHFVVIVDFVAGTVTVNGAINIAQRQAVGSVIQATGHKVFDLETGEAFVEAGPERASDEDFCRALA